MISVRFKPRSRFLSKPGKLTDIEYRLIQRHCQMGYDILKDIPFPWPVAQIALQHHERMDGTGYPQGLKAEEICLEACIVAVADVVESMASTAPIGLLWALMKRWRRSNVGVAASMTPLSSMPA